METSTSSTAGPPTTAETAILEPSPSPGRRVAGALRRAGIDLLYLSLGMLSAIAAFVVWVTGLSIALSLAPFIVGFAVAIGCAYVFRFHADLDRRLAGLVTGEPIERRYRTVPAGTGWLRRLRILLGDSQTWRDLAWLIVHSVVGFGFGVAAITIVATVLGIILSPAWWHYLPESDPMTFGLFEVDSTGHAFLASAIGLAAVPPAIGLLRLLAWLESWLAHSLLAPHSRRELERRVEHLATTRAGLADASRADLARVERDLHDGAQARIVALAMELGMAEETVASDPEAAREMVARARGEALNALGELRDLARGLRPAVLAERGLAEAVEGLATRSAIPVSTRVRGDLDDLPQRIESAAYYVIAEALTNANKHSGASAVRVSLLREGDRLTVEARDDGGGGADPFGNGLDGLRRRVAALDGSFELRSPPGGPTTIRAELPCG